MRKKRGVTLRIRSCSYDLGAPTYKWVSMAGGEIN
jgi:hypothetical protein